MFPKVKEVHSYSYSRYAGGKKIQLEILIYEQSQMIGGQLVVRFVSLIQTTVRNQISEILG